MRVYAVKYVRYYVPYAQEERSGAIKTLYLIIKWHLKMIDAKAVVLVFVRHNNNIMRVYAVKYVWYYVPCAPEERSGAIKTLY